MKDFAMNRLALDLSHQQKRWGVSGFGLTTILARKFPEVRLIEEGILKQRKEVENCAVLVVALPMDSHFSSQEVDYIVDESGTGLRDERTPFFVLTAVGIPTDRWQTIDSQVASLKRCLVSWAKPEDFEIKGRDIRRGEKFFWCTFLEKKLTHGIVTVG